MKPLPAVFRIPVYRSSSCRQRRSQWSRSVGLALLFAVAAGTEAQETISVPGGTKAIVALFEGVDADPEFFIESLNRVLLSVVRLDQSWDKVEKRHLLSEFLRTIEELKRLFPTESRLTLSAPGHSKLFSRLGGILGYEVNYRRGEVRVRLKEDKDQATRRRFARALELDVTALASQFETEGEILVRIEIDEARLPMPVALWTKLTKVPPRPDGLRTLVHDPRLGLILEGRRRLSEETRAAFDRMDVRRFYRQAPVAFRRYGGSFEVRDGEILVPGPQGSASIWREVLGQEPALSEDFWLELLTRKNGRAAYLWKSMQMARPNEAAYYLGTETQRDDRKHLKRIYRRLDEISTANFDSAAADDMGFSALVRSLPIRPTERDLYLPGGPGLWFEAIKGDRMPSKTEDLARAVGRGRSRNFDQGELLLRALVEKVDMGAYKRQVLPRLIRGLNLFWQQPAIFSEPNVILVARASDFFPPSLSVIDALDLTNPAIVQSYFMTVASLNGVQQSIAGELLLTCFQAGVDWIRALALSDKVSHEDLGRFLKEWSLIHARHQDPHAAAPEQLRWIRALTKILPSAPPGEPGRAPLERALIAALVPYEKTSFSWKGLDYVSDRGSDLRVAMAAQLETLRVGPVDQLVAILDATEELEALCGRGDIAGAKEQAQSLRDNVRSLPRPQFDPPLKDKELLSVLFNMERDRFLRVLQDLLKVKRPKKLRAFEEKVADALGFLAGDLRPVLLSPSYVVALGDQVSPALDGSDLIYKHRLVVRDKLELDHAWTVAKVEKSESSQVGTVVTGSVSTLASALSNYNLSTAVQRSTSQHVDRLRRQAWYQDLVTTPWQRLTPKVTHEFSLIYGLGRQVLDSALEESEDGGPSLTFVAKLVPTYRIERESRQATPSISPSEILMIGIAALGDETFRRQRPEFSSSEVFREPTVATRLLTSELLERTRLTGLSSPSLNGKGGRWLGLWPSYEAVEWEQSGQALREREVMDLRTPLLDYMGRHGLPGSLGADLFRRMIVEISGDLRMETTKDWPAVIRRTRLLDDDYFDERMRECLREGTYRLLDS